MSAVERLLAERDAEIARLRKACSAENDEICQTLGRALGYPWFKDNQDVFPGATEADGVCVGDHVAASLAAEAAKAVESLRAQLAGRAVVPDARPDLDPAELHARGECASEAEIAYNEGWNDCRDAMLAAASESAQAANAVARAKIDDLESRGWQQVGVVLGRDGDTPAVTVTNFGRVIWHDSPAQAAPTIRVVGEVTDGMLTGRAALRVLRVELQDDGSYTAVIDYWPPAQTAPSGPEFDERDAIAACHAIDHLIDNAETMLAALKAADAHRAQRAEPGVPEISPDELLSVARRTGLREHLHALNPTDARAILARYVAAIDAHRAQRKENGNVV